MTDNKILQHDSLFRLSYKAKLNDHTFSWDIMSGVDKNPVFVEYEGYRWDMKFQKSRQPNSAACHYLIISVGSLQHPLGKNQRFLVTIEDILSSEKWSVFLEAIRTAGSSVFTVWRTEFWLLPPKAFMFVAVNEAHSTKSILKLDLKPKNAASSSTLAEDSENPNQQIELAELSANIRSLLTDSEDSDVTLNVSGRSLKAHKNILRARSPVFHNMFQHDMKERQTGEVDISDCDASTFEAYLDYMYSGSLKVVNADNVRKVYYIANKYGSERLTRHCLEFMEKNMTVGKFVEFVSAFLENSEKSTFLDSAVKFFAENFNEIGQSAEWRDFFQSNLLQANELIMKAHNLSFNLLRDRV